MSGNPLLHYARLYLSGQNGEAGVARSLRRIRRGRRRALAAVFRLRSLWERARGAEGGRTRTRPRGSCARRWTGG